MEGGNGLQANVVGCLTPSPRITKSPNPSPIPNPVFMHVLIKIIKPVNIGDQSHLIVVRPICHVHEHAGAHIHTRTHAHICTCLHNMFTLAHNTLKNEISLSQWGSELENIKSIHSLVK